jgi:hypothetical protein
MLKQFLHPDQTSPTADNDVTILAEKKQQTPFSRRLLCRRKQVTPTMD